MSIVLRFITSSMMFFLLACTVDWDHTHPYDPDTPVSLQAKGTIKGRILLEEEADHSRTTVMINGLSHLRADTDSTGSYEITEVPAGVYTLEAVSKYTRFKNGFVKTPVDIKIGNSAVAETIELQTPPYPVFMKGAEAISGTEIEVFWYRNDAKDLAGYKLYMRKLDEPIFYAVEFEEELILPSNESNREESVVVSKLEKGIEYYFMITAVDESGNESELPLETIKQFIYPQPSSKEIIQISSINPTYMVSTRCNNSYSCIYAIEQGGKLVKINTDIDTDVAFQGDVFTNLADIEADPDRDIIYLLSLDALYKISTTGDQTLESLLNLQGSPLKIALSDNGELIYVLINDDNLIKVVKTGEKVIGDNKEEWGEDNTPYIPRYKINDIFVSEKKLYIAVKTLNQIIVLDADPESEGFLVNEIAKISTGIEPIKIHSSPESDYVVVANEQSNNITIINKFNNNLERIITVEESPRSVFISENIIYVSNYRSNSVSLISLITMDVLQCSGYCRLITGSNPHTVITNKDGSKVYVSNEFSESISIFEYPQNTQ